MNGYMELFLETGSPAFYMMAKQEGVAAGVISGGAVDGATYRVANSAANCPANPTAKEGTSPR